LHDAFGSGTLRAPFLEPEETMRFTAVALAFSLFALPSYAKGKKGPKDGQYCSKKAVGTTATDKSGNTLTCKADSKGKPRWTK